MFIDMILVTRPVLMTATTIVLMDTCTAPAIVTEIGLN